VARHLTENREAAIKATVADAATDLKGQDLNVTVAVTPGWEQGADVTVTATYPYSISLVGIPLKKGLLKSTTTERVE
jgi:hypothetical protein